MNRPLTRHWPFSVAGLLLVGAVWWCAQHVMERCGGTLAYSGADAYAAMSAARELGTHAVSRGPAPLWPPLLALVERCGASAESAPLWLGLLCAIAALGVATHLLEIERARGRVLLAFLVLLIVATPMVPAIFAGGATLLALVLALLMAGATSAVVAAPRRAVLPVIGMFAAGLALTAAAPGAQAPAYGAVGALFWVRRPILALGLLVAVNVPRLLGGAAPVPPAEDGLLLALLALVVGVAWSIVPREERHAKRPTPVLVLGGFAIASVAVHLLRLLVPRIAEGGPVVPIALTAFAVAVSHAAALGLRVWRRLTVWGLALLLAVLLVPRGVRALIHTPVACEALADGPLAAARFLEQHVHGVPVATNDPRVLGYAYRGPLTTLEAPGSALLAVVDGDAPHGPLPLAWRRVAAWDVDRTPLGAPWRIEFYATSDAARPELARQLAAYVRELAPAVTVQGAE